MISTEADAIQRRGGGCSRISPRAYVVQWGGVVAEFFSVISKSRRDSAEGGGVAEFLQEPTWFRGGG